MKDQFNEWAQLQSRRSSAALSKASKLEHIADEIRILETLLANGFHRIPGELRDVRSLLENRQKQWRDMQSSD
jgi:hypothetical protein